MWFAGGHNPILAGKDSLCKASGMGSGGRLDFSGDTVRASFNPDCPDLELKAGWNKASISSGEWITKAIETSITGQGWIHLLSPGVDTSCHVCCQDSMLSKELSGFRRTHP